MERVVYKHLYNFFHSNNFIYKLHPGFCQAIPQYSSLLISIIKFVKVLILNSIHAWSFVIFQKPLIEYGIKAFFLNKNRMVLKETF